MTWSLWSTALRTRSSPAKPAGSTAVMNAAMASAASTMSWR